MTRTTIAPSRSTASKISPVRAGVKYGSDTRTNAPPMRIAASPAQKTSVVDSSGDLVAWRWPTGVPLEARA
jgi:hypothetical protein